MFGHIVEDFKQFGNLMEISAFRARGRSAGRARVVVDRDEHEPDLAVELQDDDDQPVTLPESRSNRG